MDYHIDAKQKILGRLASEIAAILQGKKSPAYRSNRVSADKVLVKNYQLISVTGRKLKGKIYYRHTGFVGHLKSETLEQKMAKNPKAVIRESVRRMLPKNFLNNRRLKNLVFVDEK